MERILCVWSPNWAIDSWRRRRSASPADAPRPLRAAPFALVETVRGVRRLACVDPLSARLGLFAGQKAADAAALVPELVVADLEPQADAAALTELAHWCVRFSPAVAADPPEVVRVLVGQRRHVVHDEHARHAAPPSSTVNRVPVPGSVATRREPPMSATSRRTTESPRPVPPGLLV
jgi:hypothetical protein